MATNNRESRRRKVLERGSDRLAFISGRGAPQPLIHHKPETDSSKPSISYETCLSDQTPVTPIGDDKGEGDSFGSTLLKQDPVVDAGSISAFNNERNAISSLPECKTSIEASSAPVAVVSGREKSSLITSTDQISSVSASSREQLWEPQRGQHKFLTPSQISSAISATERTRLFCSIAIALLVILSYLGFPPFRSSIIKSIARFRPLYLVLLTDITIVLARLLFDNRGGFQWATRGGNDIRSTDGWAQVSNALEVGWTMLKVIDAIFMDCSIYSIVVICSLVFSW